MKTPWMIVIPAGLFALALVIGVAHVAGSVIEGGSNAPNGPG